MNHPLSSHNICFLNNRLLTLLNMEPRPKILQEDEEDLTSSPLSPLPLDIKGDDDNDKFEDGAKQKQKSSNNIKLPLSNKCSTAIALVFVIGIFAAALTASLRESTHESSRVSSQQQQVVTVASGRSSCDGKSLQIDLETDNYGCVLYVQ